MIGSKKDNIRRGVVLGGGGSKGSYEAGVWQAMEELEIGYSVVTGTSVGALNGALMVVGELDEALHMWNTLDNTRVMSDIPATGDAAKLQQVYQAFIQQILKNGGVDISPLENTIRRLVNEDRMRSSPIEFGIVTVEFPTMQPVEWFLPQIPAGQVADFLLASAACFPAFRPRQIGNISFVDGGYANNIPIDLALKAQNPVDEIIAVDVEGIGITRKLPKDLAIPVTTLRCYWDLGSILIFDSAQCRRNIRLGYLDGRKLFGDYEGQAYTFAPGETGELEQRHLNGLSRCYLTAAKLMGSSGKNEINSLLASRIVVAATRRRQTGDELDLPQLLLASAELAAELLELSPTQLYTARSFDQLLEERFAQLRQRTNSILAGLQSRALDLRSLISGYGKEQLLAVCFQLVHTRLSAPETPGVPLELIAALLPKETLASLYLEALLYNK